MHKITILIFQMFGKLKFNFLKKFKPYLYYTLEEIDIFKVLSAIFLMGFVSVC